MLGVLAVIDRARHLLLLLVVHLGVDVAVAGKFSEKQRGIGILSPKPRTVGFVVFVRFKIVLLHKMFHLSAVNLRNLLLVAD